jgi:lipopolysaccharide export system permease protein
MTKIDRYILFLFARTMLICFLSIGGVFVVFHAFSNLDDLIRLGTDSGSLPIALIRFYGPYMMMLFDWTAAIIALMAMLFTVSWLRRSGELTALLAAGVRHGRVLRPMLFVVAVVIIGQSFCRELLIPSYREVLTSKPGELRVAKAKSMLPSYDKSSGLLIEGEGLYPSEARIERPSFRLYTSFPGFGDVIDGESAVYRDATDELPAGYLVSGVTRPAAIDSLATGKIRDRPVVMTRTELPWLEPGQCFVLTSLDIEVLRDNPRSTRMAGMPELMRRIRNGSVHSSKELHTLLHDRMLRPPLDFCLVLLGLPLVVNRGDKGLFNVIGQAIGIVLLFFGVKTVAAAMAGGGYFLTPALAAWVPLLLLGPLAYVRYRDAQEQ